MDIVDTQIHIGPGGIAEAIAAMDALGIQSVLIDEWWMGTEGHPSYKFGDFVRSATPTAELASWSYPGRFSYVIRPDRRDPELGSLIRLARDSSYARALRIIPGITRAEAKSFAEGAYEEVFANAAECNLPIFAAVGGIIHLLQPYLEKFPSVKVIVCHCGMPPSKVIRPAIAALEGLPDSEEYWSNFCNEPIATALDNVLRIADYPNVALKWAHASAAFEAPGFGNKALHPFLRKTLDAFGAERVMWASDVSASLTGESWAELLFGIRCNPDLSESECERILGGTARQWLNWQV